VVGGASFGMMTGVVGVGETPSCCSVVLADELALC